MNPGDVNPTTGGKAARLSVGAAGEQEMEIIPFRKDLFTLIKIYYNIDMLYNIGMLPSSKPDSVGRSEPEG